MHKKGAQRGQGVIVLREGVTNKGGGYRAEETNRQTNKCTSKSTRMGAQKRGGNSRKRRAP